jgi:hypothetical protein
LLNAMGARAKMLKKEGKPQEAQAIETQIEQFESKPQGPPPTYSVNGIKIESPEVINQMIENMDVTDLSNSNIEITNDPELSTKLQDKMVTSSIKEEVRSANPDLDEDTLDQITALEKERKKFEGKKTQSAKDKLASINSQIKTLQENAVQKPSTEEGVLRPEESQVGLQEVGKGDTQEQAVAQEVVQETESKIKRRDLFDGVGAFSRELGGSDVDAVPVSHSENNGIEFVQYANPKTGSVDVIVTGTSENDFVGFYRIYENGKPTNKWSSKFENQSRNKGNFKTMIGGIQEMLPEGHEYTEKTSISTDGLRVWNQQLDKGYEIQYDQNGNPITNEVAINGDAIVNELGIDVNPGAFDNIRVTTNEQFDKVKNALLPYLTKMGLNESNIKWENGTVKIDLPVLKKSSQDVQEEVITPDEEVQAAFDRLEIPEGTEEAQTVVTEKPIKAPKNKAERKAAARKGNMVYHNFFGDIIESTREQYNDALKEVSETGAIENVLNYGKVVSPRQAPSESEIQYEASLLDMKKEDADSDLKRRTTGVVSLATPVVEAKPEVSSKTPKAKSVPIPVAIPKPTPTPAPTPVAPEPTTKAVGPEALRQEYIDKTAEVRLNKDKSRTPKQIEERVAELRAEYQKLKAEMTAPKPKAKVEVKAEAKPKTEAKPSRKDETIARDIKRLESDIDTTESIMA